MLGMHPAQPSPSLRTALGLVFAVSVVFTLVLLVKSAFDFTTTGPTIRDEILAHYTGYAAFTLARLAGWTLLIAFLLGGLGALLYASLCAIFDWRLRRWAIACAAGAGLAGLSAVQFIHQLLYIPSSIVASSLYDMARFHPLWEQLSPRRLLIADSLLAVLVVIITATAAWRLARQGKYRWSAGLIGAWSGVLALGLWATWAPEVTPIAAAPASDTSRPNILLIGSDTLRADRIGLNGYTRNLTPFIDQLAARGTFFTNAYVPLARTAPSITSLLTGTWPHTHGVRDNYISDQAAQLPVAGLPSILARSGYHTVSIGDWAASDLSKLSLGFQETHTAPDQWNLKYLMRQGPKDIRLFLSLFTHNQFGRRFLPELYYLAGVPLTSHMTREAEQALNQLAAQKQPFLLNVFIATTHAPFGSEYPYYTLFSDHAYRGSTKFAIDGLKDPSSIIKRQEEDASAFDVDQIINLYDGAVRQFDDAVADIVGHLRAQGLERNTLIVIYSDHGTDLFERQSWGQGNSVIGRDPSARIPLLIIDPRRPGGTMVKHVVRSVDLAPTLLGLLNQPVPAAMEGVSLIPYLDDPKTDLDLAAFHETGVWLGNIPGLANNHLRYPSLLEMLEIPDKQSGTLALKPEFEQRVIQAKDRMLRTDRWKLVYLPMQDGAVYWLFDIIADPDCEVNVIDRYPEVAAQLRQRLIDWISADAQFTWNGSYLVSKSPQRTSIDNAPQRQSHSQ